MKNLAIYILAATISLPGIAFCETAPATDSVKTPSIATPDMVNPNAPVAGKNSFTEDQARARIEKAGYSDVSKLILDSEGIWRGTAKKLNVMMNVTIDYQGNVTSSSK